MPWAKRIATGGVAAVALGALVWALLPDPVPVDLVTVHVGPMEVTVAAEGITRVRDPWTVTAPLTGTTARSPVEVGDPVVAGQSVVAEIRPAAAGFLDARARAQAQASVSEAEAAVRVAEVALAKAEADLNYAQSQLTRNRVLVARGVVSERVVEDNEQAVITATRTLEAARYNLDLQRATLDRVRAQLSTPVTDATGEVAEGCCLQLTAPLDGTVLEVTDIDARLVLAGAPLVTVGDLGDLEIETDLLSSDAVRVALGAAAHVERWGGPAVLDARVTRIEPAAFTRVSALGIEEQRVRLHLDILTPPEARPGLGDRFRVFVRVVVWSDPGVLQVPQSALFRQDGGWAVYRAVEGRALRTPVTLGEAGELTVQILEGLSEGDAVVAYPGSSIADGTRITPRDGT